MRGVLKAISLIVDLLSLAGCSLIAYAGVTTALVMSGLMLPGQPMFGEHVVPELSRCVYFLILGAALLMLTQYAQRKIKRGLMAFDDAANLRYQRKRL